MVIEIEETAMPTEYTAAGIIRKRLMLKFETVEEATQISAL